jgi:hypothetical protein
MRRYSKLVSAAQYKFEFGHMIYNHNHSRAMLCIKFAIYAGADISELPEEYMCHDIYFAVLNMAGRHPRNEIAVLKRAPHMKHIFVENYSGEKIGFGRLGQQYPSRFLEDYFTWGEIISIINRGYGDLNFVFSMFQNGFDYAPMFSKAAQIWINSYSDLIYGAHGPFAMKDSYISALIANPNIDDYSIYQLLSKLAKPNHLISHAPHIQISRPLLYILLQCDGRRIRASQMDSIMDIAIRAQHSVYDARNSRQCDAQHIHHDAYHAHHDGAKDIDSRIRMARRCFIANSESTSAECNVVCCPLAQIIRDWRFETPHTKLDRADDGGYVMARFIMERYPQYIDHIDWPRYGDHILGKLDPNIMLRIICPRIHFLIDCDIGADLRQIIIKYYGADDRIISMFYNWRAIEDRAARFAAIRKEVARDSKMTIADIIKKYPNCVHIYDFVKCDSRGFICEITNYGHLTDLLAKRPSDIAYIWQSRNDSTREYMRRIENILCGTDYLAVPYSGGIINID